MPSNRSIYWTAIAVIVSLIVYVMAWHYSLGLEPLFTFIAGASFTIFAHEILEKKRQKRNFDIKMTQRIYGPLHKELRSILTNLRASELVSGTSLNNVIEDFRFNLVDKELRCQVKEFRERLLLYPDLYLVASHKTDSHTHMELTKHKIKGQVKFVVLLGNREIFTTIMQIPILGDKTPLDYLTEKARPYKNTRMIVYADNVSEGDFSSEHRIHQFSMDILKRVREDPSVQEQRREREYLLEECNSLIESLKKEIVL